VEIDKDLILNFLKDRGRQDEATKAAEQLPDKVDTERDSGLLSQLGIDTAELLGKLPGGLGDKIGGLLGDK